MGAPTNKNKTGWRKAKLAGKSRTKRTVRKRRTGGVK
jgi:hypothetical protein